MVSALDRAKRALVVVLRSLASAYRCSVNATRDSSDAEVRKAYRAISRRTHPDRGGSTADQQKLNDAYDSWCQASQNRGRAGRPSTQQQAEQQQQQQGGLAAQPAEEMDGSRKKDRQTEKERGGQRKPANTTWTFHGEGRIVRRTAGRAKGSAAVCRLRGMWRTARARASGRMHQQAGRSTVPKVCVICGRSRKLVSSFL